MTGDIIERMKAALRSIAKEADDWETYILGNNCYGPDCPLDIKDGYPARVSFKLLSDARTVLAEAEKLGEPVLYPAIPAAEGARVMADELKRALDTIMRPGFGALRPTAITPAEGDDMTPHQKAIEALALSAYKRQRDVPIDWEREAEWIKEKYRKGAAEDFAAGLASARKSGWELKPREAFDSFEDAS